VPSAPTDSLETVVTLARVRVNDAIASANGDVLTDTQPFTIFMINGAWRRTQMFLADRGFTALENRMVFAAIPSVTNSDYSSLEAMTWSGFFDGTAVQAAPLLPQDMIAPLKLAERVNSSGNNFTPMDQCYSGLPTVSKGPLNRLWEWRTNVNFPGTQTINMPGATGPTDLILFYAAFLADFVVSGTTAFSAQPVPIINILSPLAWLIGAECVKPRGDVDAGSFETAGFAELQQIFNRDLAQPRTIYKPSETGKMTGRGTPSMAPNPRNPQQ
jgi:hypothetical protein